MGLNLDAKIQGLKTDILDYIRPPLDLAVSFFPDLKPLAQMLSKLAKLGPEIVGQTSILSSLYFPEMKDRYKQITAASEETFDWIF